MAVGKVGSFATVEPAIVDFGGMAKGYFDDIKAEQERKRKEEEALAEKRRQEINKVGGLGFIPSTNVKGFNEGLQSVLVNELKPEFAKAISEGNIQKAEEIKSQVEALANSSEQFVKTFKAFSENRDNLNPAYFSQTSGILNSIDALKMDVKSDKNGRVSFTVYEDDEKTKPLLVDRNVNEIADVLFNIPERFNLSDIKIAFAKTQKPNIEQLVNEKKGIITKEVLFDDDKLSKAVNAEASRLANNPSSLADWWVSQHPDKPLKMNWSKEEKEEAKKYYEEQLKTTTYEDYKETIFNRGRGGGSGSGDKKKVWLGQPNILPKVGTLSNAIYAPILKDSTDPVGISLNGERIDGVAYDRKTNKIYGVKLTATGQSSGTNSKSQGGGGGEGFSAGVRNTDNVNKLIEIPSTQYTQLSNIAQAVGYSSPEALLQYMKGFEQPAEQPDSQPQQQPQAQPIQSRITSY